MTTKTDSFTVTENPLATSWNGVGMSECRAAGSGAFGGGSPGDTCVSVWDSVDYAFAADQDSEITIGSLTDYDDPGAVVRATSTGGGQGYFAWYLAPDGLVRVNLITAGARVNPAILEVSSTFVDGDKLKLAVAGTTLTIYKNGASIGSVSDATYATGQPGIQYLRGGGNTTRITLWTGTDGAGAGPAITSVSTATPREGASLSILGTAFGASQGAGNSTINSISQAETSWADTSVAVTVVLGTNKFGAPYNVALTDNAGTPSNNYAGITGLLPANSGLSFVDVGTPNPTAEYRLTAVADIASGDQIEYDNVGGLVTVYDDATFAAGPGVTSFSFRVWTPGSGYGAYAEQSTTGSGTGLSKLRYPGMSYPQRLGQGVSYYDP